MEPNAQGELAPTQTADDEKSGAEKRINEITAEKYKLAGERDSYAQANQNLTATVAQLMAQMEAMKNAPAPEPEVEIDDDTRKKFDKLISPTLKKFEAMMGQMQTQMAVSNVNPLAQKYGVPEEIANRARELVRAQRVPEQTAITFAIGEAAMAGKWGGNGDRQHNNSIATNNVMGSGGVPKGNVTPPSGPIPYPPDFNSWNPNRQMAWINKNRPDVHEQTL